MKKIPALFALLLNVALVVAQPTAFPVRFEHGTVFFPENFAAWRAARNALPGNDGLGHCIFYLQCKRILTTAERAALENQDAIEFLGYVDFGAYLVKVPATFSLDRLANLPVRSIVSVQPAWKMARSLLEPPFGAWAVHGDWLDVQLQIYPHLSILQGAELCRQNGLRVLREGRQNGFLLVQIRTGQRAAVAALPFVQRLELAPPPPVPDDTRGRSLHRANLLDGAAANGLHYDGTGVKVLVRDDGLIGPHIDFQGRTHNRSTDNGAEQHGDGVAGVLAGAGNLDPEKRGMAAGAEVFVIDYVADFQDQTLDLHLDEGVNLTNSSYSEQCNEGYTINTQTVDQQLFEHPTLLHVFSAGNRGTSDCGYGAGVNWGNITGGHKIAKNAIATANLRPDASLDATSSRGPTADGRLKPDISANGTDQASTGPDNAYITFGGTSAAAPGIVGCLAQLTQAWKTTHNGQDPPAALLKAAVLNTATDLGNPGPDFRFGFGHVNAGRAWRLLDNQRYWNYETQPNGAGATLVVNVPPGTRQAKIMLLWSDPPALPGAAKALVNDLDLQVESPGGDLFLPLILNPAPNSTTLNAPAVPGRDSLNNVEQVVLNNPPAGSYLATVQGFAVPFGPQPYWIVWEFLSDSVKITYPAGGEGLVPGETVRVYWDAYSTTPDENFSLEFFDGQNWTNLAAPAYYERFYDWAVPAGLATGQARLRLSRGGATDETGTFSLVGVPQNLDIVRVCPDSLTVAWSPVNDTLAYEVYLLGERYMEIHGTTNAPALTLPIENALAEQWVSVRATGPAGLDGRRAVAVYWPGELKECQQPYDLGVRVLAAPDPAGIFSCGPVQQTISIEVRNEGLNPISGALLSFQANGQPPVTEALPALAPGETLIHNFQPLLFLNTNDSLLLKVWASYLPDDFKLNDTLRFAVPVVTVPADDYFVETFENQAFPPLGWAVINPDGATTWQRGGKVPGLDGLPSRAVLLNCFNYPALEQEDGIQLIAVDLSAIPAPALRFDVAHARFGNNVERLRVEVFPDCDLGAAPVVLWDKSDPELGTTTPTNGSFVPNEAADWRSEVVDLAAFANQSVILRLVATNDYGNNIFLDNIGIAPYDLAPPVAAFVLPADSICRGDTVSFSALPGGNFAEYNWTFGSVAIPGMAFGPGPHQIFYPSPGLKLVRLVVSNPLGTDTATLLLTVLGFPVINFSAAPAGLSVSFTNASENALSYAWDFGDGSTSTDVSPVHTYAGGGTYLVKLTAANQCKTVTDSIALVLSVGTDELENLENVRIVPNPTDGDFQVNVWSMLAGEVRLTLFDAVGREVKTLETALAPGFTTIPVEGLDLPKGIYQLRLNGGTVVRMLTVVVQ